MRQRGRKSGTALSVPSAVALVERPTAPVELTPEQADAWQQVVDAMPADWFSAENYPLLKQYVRHEIEARRIAQLIDQECIREDMDVSAYNDLLKAQERQTSALKAMASALRLSQQSSYSARGAAGEKDRRVVKRPWQSD